MVISRETRRGSKVSKSSHGEFDAFFYSYLQEEHSLLTRLPIVNRRSQLTTSFKDHLEFSEGGEQLKH